MAASKDKRVIRSRKAIFGALEQLLKKKSYSSITVNDIIETANVGRTTFYEHFPTKDAVFDELSSDIFAHIVSPGIEESHSYSAKNIKEQFLHVLSHLAEQKERLAPLFAGPSSHLFWEAIESHMTQFIEEHLGAGIKAKPGIKNQLYAAHLGRSFCDVSKWWFQGELTETPEAAFDAFQSLTDIKFITPGSKISAKPAIPSFKETEMKALIKRSLLTLLPNKRLDNISVREITSKANIGRTTFYSYYPNLLAVYRELVRDALSDVRTLSDQLGCNRCTPSHKVPFCERLRAEDGFTAVIEEPLFFRTWLGELGNEPSSTPTRAFLMNAGIARPQAEAVMFFQTAGCLLVARSAFGKRSDWEQTRKTLDAFITGGYNCLTNGALT